MTEKTKTVNTAKIVYQGNYKDHKIFVVKRHIAAMNLDDKWFCGYVSRNRNSHKVKLDVAPSSLFEIAENDFECFGGVTFTGQLDYVLNFAGDVIGFDSQHPGMENLTLDEVIADTKHLCDQLVDFENEHQIK